MLSLAMQDLLGRCQQDIIGLNTLCFQRRARRIRFEYSVLVFVSAQLICENSTQPIVSTGMYKVSVFLEGSVLIFSTKYGFPGEGVHSRGPIPLLFGCLSGR
ncbi:hypothetical protein [Komagataeibacter europaeus]|uniref:hypothetical protein n=1 Tax=Komagataeibacter europaeus TaxID=33995 RepID=UPI0012FB2A5F|nr:hypothetical protein [Komagataeibacter europaeus]